MLSNFAPSSGPAISEPQTNLIMQDQRALRVAEMKSEIQTSLNLLENMVTSWVQQQATQRGFKYDEYNVVTNDGYVLTLMRIRKKSTKKGAPVVFFQHGINGSADHWVAHIEDQSPAFQFANNGYDVWLGNSRGNKYNKQHQTLNPYTQAKEFFDFDFQQQGDHDIPAVIDKVLEVTNVPNLTYIGHSVGTTQLFYKLATDEQALSEKINLFVALAPLTKFGSMNVRSQMFLKSRYAVNRSMIESEYYEVPPEGMDIKEMCSDETETFNSICWMVNMIYSHTSIYCNTEAMKLNSHRFFQASSWREYYHILQMMDDGQFEKYDEAGDVVTPAAIDLKKIKKVPIAIFAGDSDAFSQYYDAVWATTQLESLVQFELISGFDHQAFLVGQDMSYIKDVMNLVQEYNNK